MTWITTTISDSDKELKSHQAILLESARAFRSRVIRKEILREYLRETLIYITGELRRYLRLWTT
jgi:hypothetical protein